MKRALSTWERPPSDLQESRAQSTNFALVSASEISTHKLWQRRASRLPQGTVLLVMLRDNHSSRSVANRISAGMAMTGRRVVLARVRSLNGNPHSASWSGEQPSP